MARRGFFAEIQHQSRVAARERDRAALQAYRLHAATVRQAEQAARNLERAKAQLSKSLAADRKRLEKEAREAYLASKEAEVEERNGALQEVYEEIDSLLASTLGRDDFVDLNALRVEVSHPPFDRTDLETPLPLPKGLSDPVAPVLVLPDPPAGIAKFFGMAKHTEFVERARRTHAQEMDRWSAACRDAQLSRRKAEEAHLRDEANRVESLKVAREKYALECAGRELEAKRHNEKLAQFIANLGYGTSEAIQEYVSIVLSNSAYPEHFQVTHEFEFDSSTAELKLRVLVPPPGSIPEIKQYKYSKTSDEVVSTPLPQKECRERYAGAIHQVALRSFHEVFESDRRGLIKTISLEITTHAIDPATGIPSVVPFVVAAAERNSFLTFDLSAVVPALTLKRLGAAISKNPYGLVAADGAGIRRT